MTNFEIDNIFFMKYNSKVLYIVFGGNGDATCCEKRWQKG